MSGILVEDEVRSIGTRGRFADIAGRTASTIAALASRMHSERAGLKRDLLTAIRTGAIVPFYQPLTDLRDDGVIGLEVLARWNHPVRGPIEPQEFIGVAESARLLDALSLKLLEQAIHDAARWDKALTMSFNLSPNQICGRRIGRAVLDVLDANGFDPARLMIEITEMTPFGDLVAAKATIEELKRAGVRIALDDLGAGCSSLCYLRELAFDVVKIDQSFMMKRSNPKSAKIIAAVINLCEALGLATVAEGVETSADADWLREHGCAAGQGFLYARPVPADEVPAILARLGTRRLRAA